MYMPSCGLVKRVHVHGITCNININIAEFGIPRRSSPAIINLSPSMSCCYIGSHELHRETTNMSITGAESHTIYTCMYVLDNQ